MWWQRSKKKTVFLLHAQIRRIVFVFLRPRLVAMSQDRTKQNRLTRIKQKVCCFSYDFHIWYAFYSLVCTPTTTKRIRADIIETIEHFFLRLFWARDDVCANRTHWTLVVQLDMATKMRCYGNDEAKKTKNEERENETGTIIDITLSKSNRSISYRSSEERTEKKQRSNKCKCVSVLLRRIECGLS